MSGAVTAPVSLCRSFNALHPSTHPSIRVALCCLAVCVCGVLWCAVTVRASACLPACVWCCDVDRHTPPLCACAGSNHGQSFQCSHTHKPHTLTRHATPRRQTDVDIRASHQSDKRHTYLQGRERGNGKDGYARARPAYVGLFASPRGMLACRPGCPQKQPRRRSDNMHGPALPVLSSLATPTHHPSLMKPSTAAATMRPGPLTRQ